MSSQGSFLSRPWLVVGTSAAAIGILSLLLASPWDRRSRQGGKPLVIYCAAGMNKPVEEILEEYERAYGVKVQPTYSGSGDLLSKLRVVKGHADLYLSADVQHIEEGRKDGLVAEIIPLAVLRPVLIVNSKTKANLEHAGRKLTSFRDVLDSDLKFVLANPKTAAIGQLTKEALVKAGFWPRVQERLEGASARASTVDKVNEVLQVVRTREGFTGVVWTANAEAFDDLHMVPLPEFAGKRELLQVGVLTNSEQPTAALHLARYLAASDRGSKIFRKHHYESIDDADMWEDVPTIHLSAGAMLEPGIADVIASFQTREGVEIQTNYGGCGLLVGQMKGIHAGDNAMHFPDAYFACDQSFLDDVQEWFETGVLLARNPMVLAVANGNPLNIQGLADLRRADLRVGLAHPVNSALGKLTDDLLLKMHLHDGVYEAKRRQPIVHTDAAHLLINQLRVGALDVAVVYKSNVLSAAGNKEHLQAIDLNLPGALASQPFAIARESRHKYLVRRLLQAIVAPDNAAHFRSLGFNWIHEAK